MLRNVFNRFLNEREFVRGSLHRNDRIGALNRAWGHVFNNHLKGDYIEFGVYGGETFVESFRQYLAFRGWLERQLVSPEPWRRDVAAGFINFTPRFHGMDTFGGMPANDEGNERFAEGTFHAELSAVQAKCEKVFQAGPDGVEAFKLYKGLFADTGPELLQNVRQKAAIINIDCDIYESARDALNLCESLMQVGTVVMFDDYNAFAASNRAGERKAFAEFSSRSRFVFEKWFSYQFAGQAFLCVDESQR